MYPPTANPIEAKNKINVTNKEITLFLRLFNDHSKMPEIPLVSLVNPASKPCNIFPKNECLPICDNLPKREYNQGTNVNDTSKDNNVATTTVMQNCLRSEEHTSELQSRENLVCRLLLEKKTHK